MFAFLRQTSTVSAHLSALLTLEASRSSRDASSVSRADRWATSFPVHKIVEVQGQYTCAFFVSATDDAKKCTTITAHVHWKCAVISVYFFASGKARLPKTHPLRVACPLPMPFRHTRAFW